MEFFQLEESEMDLEFNKLPVKKKDYIKLLDYSSGIIPKEMIRTWMKIAKQYNFKLTKSETKLWFK